MCVGVTVALNHGRATGERPGSIGPGAGSRPWLVPGRETVQAVPHTPPGHQLHPYVMSVAGIFPFC